MATATSGRRSPTRPPPSSTSRTLLTGKHFFPELIAALFHDGLIVVFGVAAVLAAIAAAASWQRGGRAVVPQPKEVPNE